MPVKSYLAYPHDGRKTELIQSLSALSGCEVIPAENHDLLVLVTETEDNFQEKELREKLDAIDSMKLLTMVSGFTTPLKNNE